MRLIPCSAFFVLLALSGADAATRVGAPSVQACAPGYRPDRGGNCQPNGGETSRFCPPGTVYAPFPDGWTCNPPPREAY